MMPTAHRAWLEQHFVELLHFFRDGLGHDGLAVWLDDAGRPMPQMPSMTYSTARLVHCFALGTQAGLPGCREQAAAALGGLNGRARDADHGGWVAGFDGAGQPDATKTAYTHAFVLLAASSALRVGIEGAQALFDDAAAIFLERFWDDDAGLLRDAYSPDWGVLDPYRGMNANMHGVEAMLAAQAATGDGAWLRRAERVARFFVDQAAANDWRLPEHYDEDWQPLLNYNIERPDDQFKPFGSTVGHSLEWSRLLLELSVALGHDEGLHEAARQLFDRAVADGWDVDGTPGFVYTVDWDGRPVTRDRLHWVLAEAIAAAATFLQFNDDEQVAALYAEWWDYADQYVIDHELGSWRHQLDHDNRPAATIWPGKNDLYHALQATFVCLRAAGVPYGRSALQVGIAHIGVGGFHRAHEAAHLDALFRRGLDTDWAVQGIGILPADRLMQDVLSRQDGQYTLVVKHPDGTFTPRVIGALQGMSHLLDDPDGVLALLTKPGLRIVSLTITEGGYPVSPDTMLFDDQHQSVKADLEAPEGPPTTAFGLLVEALRRRHELGIEPFTVLSCDNIRHNGAVARASVLGMAERLVPELGSWLEGVAFPNSMVDRITPSTTDSDRELVASWGIDDAWPVVCEPFTQWVIEDHFPTGRPAWEQVGATFTTDVESYELMKLRMLNAGHQLIGHIGRHLGLTYVHEALAHPALRALLSRFLTREAIPTLAQPEGIDLVAYHDSLLERFSNPEVKDSLARLCAFASDRIPKFMLGTVRDNLAADGEILCSSIVLAAWALGSRGVNENGEVYEVVDALAAELREASLLENSVPGAFLDHPVFGDLGRDARMRAEYLKALGRLERLGTEATIAGPARSAWCADLDQ